MEINDFILIGFCERMLHVNDNQIHEEKWEFNNYTFEILLQQVKADDQ